MRERVSSCWKRFRFGDNSYEQLPGRELLSFAEWFTFNPFGDQIAYGDVDPHCGKYLCTAVLARLVFVVCWLCVIVLALAGLFAGLGTHDCSATDPHDCEATYHMWISALGHAAGYLAIWLLLMWPSSWKTARTRDVIIIALLAYPVVYRWLLHSSVDQPCRDFYSNHCEACYNYSKMTRLSDIVLVGLTLVVLLVAVFTPDEEDTSNLDGLRHPAVDLSIMEHLFTRPDRHWKRPLLVQSKVIEYSEDVKDWRSVVVQRNATLAEAVKNADIQQKDSNNQAKLLGKYSSLINDTNEKATRTADLLKEQANKLEDMNQAVDTVLGALGSGSEFELRYNAFAMKFSDFLQWSLVCSLCCLVTIGVLVGIPLWLRLLNIKLGVNI